MKHEIFVSYASQDRAVAEAVREAFENAGTRCWIAPRDIAEGQDWSSAIPPAIDACRFFLLVLSASASASTQVARELHIAQAAKRTVVPFRVDAAEPDGALRYLLSGLHRLDAPTGDPVSGIGALLERVRRLSADGPPVAPESHQIETPNDLPHQTHPLLGRATELEKLKSLLREHRLVTIVGPGGVGKTRIAVEAAHELLGEFRAGVRFVELASVNDPSLVESSIAGSTAEPDDGARLLVIDNCEHVLDAAASAVKHVLEESPQTRVLCTSRQALGLRDETSEHLRPLAVPHARTGVPTLDELNASPASRLFLDRAGTRAAQSLASESARSAVAELCKRLDGLPLALELAAARANVLSFEQIAKAIDERFKLLTKGAHDALPHHQRLDSLIAWSVDLLAPPERELLISLGVFPGRFSLDDVVAVEGADDVLEIVEALDALIERSLVVSLGVQAEKQRYDLLESVRAFDRSQLGSERLDRLGDLLVSHTAQVVEALAASQNVVSLLNAELDNVRHLLHRSLVVLPSASGLSAMTALKEYWVVSSRWSEAAAWYDKTLAFPNLPSVERAKLLLAAGTIELYESRFERAGALFSEALLLAADDQALSARIRSNLGIALFNSGDHERARDEWRSCIPVLEATGGQVAAAFAQCNLAQISAELDNDLDGALEMYIRAEHVLRSAGLNDRAAIALLNTAEIRYLRGDASGATADATSALAAFKEMSDESYVADCLRALAKYEVTRGERRTAAMLLRDALETFARRNQQAEIAECTMLVAEIAHLDGEFATSVELHAFAESLRSRLPGVPRRWDVDRWAELKTLFSSSLTAAEYNLRTRNGTLRSPGEGASLALSTLDTVIRSA